MEEESEKRAKICITGRENFVWEKSRIVPEVELSVFFLKKNRESVKPRRDDDVGFMEGTEKKDDEAMSR